MERLGVERAGAFVEQVGHQVGDAGLVLRVLGGAAAEGEVDGDQRNRRIAHQPGLDAARADHALDLHRLRGRGGGCKRGAGEQRDQVRIRRGREQWTATRSRAFLLRPGVLDADSR